MREESEVASPSGVSYPVTQESADQLQPSVGATGRRTATTSVAGPSIGQLVAINPA